MSMPIQSLYIGMEVRHPQYGVGVVKALTELSSDQGSFLSPYSTNFNVHYWLAFRSSASYLRR